MKYIVSVILITTILMTAVSAVETKLSAFGTADLQDSAEQMQANAQRASVLVLKKYLARLDGCTLKAEQGNYVLSAHKQVGTPDGISYQAVSPCMVRSSIYIDVDSIMADKDIQSFRYKFKYDGDLDLADPALLSEFFAWQEKVILERLAAELGLTGSESKTIPLDFFYVAKKSESSTIKGKVYYSIKN